MFLPQRRAVCAHSAAKRGAKWRGRPACGLHGLHLAHPELGPKPLLARLREQQPDLAAGNKEVREALALAALKI